MLPRNGRIAIISGKEEKSEMPLCNRLLREKKIIPRFVESGLTDGVTTALHYVNKFALSTYRYGCRK
ncbi:hypothetical protein NXX42_27230 [Bacteroides thetaiotaomicron]|nr:hypothetical protein [Bacteroides thetaiotaomicron]